MIGFNKQYRQLLKELHAKPLPSEKSIIQRYIQTINEADANDLASVPQQEHPKYNARVVRSLINAVRDYVMKANPYFGYLLQQMQVIVTLEISTMAVDNKRNLYINPDFLLELGKGHVEITETGFKINQENNPIAFVIAHEVYHIFNETFGRERGRRAVILFGPNEHPYPLWNIATDYEMNYRLQYTYGLKPPDCGMLCDADGVTAEPVDFTGKRYMVKGSTAERLYTIMLRDALEIEKVQKENQPLKPDPNAKPNHQFKIGDKIMIKGSVPPDWQEVIGILPNGDLETKPVIQKPVFPYPVKVIYR